MNILEYMTSKPDNQGKRWSKEDLTKISSMLEDDESHTDIAKELKRTVNSIECQVCVIGAKMLEDKKTMSDVVDFTGLSQEVIEKFVKSKDKKKEKDKEKKKGKEKAKDKAKDKKAKKKKEDDSDSQSSNEDSVDPVDAKMIGLLTEIRDLLKANKEGFSFDN